MKRFGRQTNVFRNIIIQIQDKLESIFGLFIFVMICVFTCGTNTYNRNTNNEHIASIFAAGFAADPIIQPNAAIKTQRDRNDFTLSVLANNLPAMDHLVKSTRFTKNIRIAVEKIFVEDALHPDIDKCQYVEITLIWNPNTSEYKNDVNFGNGIVNKLSSRSDRQLLWNPDVYSNDILSDNEYDAGTLFVVIHKHSIPIVTENNTFKSTAQTEINYTKLEKTSPFECKVYGSNFNNWNVNFFNRESR